MRISHKSPDTECLNEDLAETYRQLQNFSETLRVLSQHWPNARPVSLWWDEHRNVLATDAAVATYRAIYGNDLVRGLRYLWKSTARLWRGRSLSYRKPLMLDAPLPADAVAIPQRSQGPKGIPYVLTIISEQQKSVVKVFAKERKDRFENELNAWCLAQAAGIGHRVPEIISSGESPSGFCWLILRLVRNSAVFYPPLISHWLWRRYLLKQMLPDLQRFYERSGVEVLNGGDLLDQLRDQAAKHPMSVALHELAELAENARTQANDDRMTLAVVHGDLRPHNVHRHGGTWWLIDWSMSRRAPLLVDLWPNPSADFASEACVAWLRGNASINALPRSLRASLDMYTDWQSSWMGIKPDTRALRFQALAMLLHRLSRHYWSTRSAVNVRILNTLGIEIHPSRGTATLSSTT